MTAPELISKTSLIERFAQIDKKFAWSFLGVLLAVFGFWFTRDNPAALSVELLSKARVYDVHADVPKLAILFDGENIKEKKQVLSFFTVRVRNSGGKPITQNLYDTNLPFGLQIANARAFPPELIEASQGYLSSNLKPTLGEGNQIRFEKLVIDSGASFTIRFLVLHPENLEPFIKPLGKIADNGSFDSPIKDVLASNGQKSLWMEVIEGSLLVQVIRFCGYFLAGIIGLIAFFMPAVFVGELKDRRKKKKVGIRFCAYQGDRGSAHANLLADFAVQTGEIGLAFISRLDGLSPPPKPPDHKNNSGPRADETITRLGMDGPMITLLGLLGKLYSAQVLSHKNGMLQLEPKFKEELKDFILFWHANEPTDAEKTSIYVDDAIKAVLKGDIDC